MDTACVGFDTETEPFRSGLMAPPLACLSVATPEGVKLYHHTEALEPFCQLLAKAAAGDITLIGQNVGYDMAVMAAHAESLGHDIMPDIFNAYDVDWAVVDTELTEKLIRIYDGTLRGGYEEDEDGTTHFVKNHYSLAELVTKHLGVVLDKDTWRTGYGSLRHEPLSKWPEGAQQYAREDARVTRELFLAQVEDADRRTSDLLANLPAQTQAGWTLRLMANWGLCASQTSVKDLDLSLARYMAAWCPELQAAGLLRSKLTKKGTYPRDMKAIRARVEDYLGAAAPRTEPSKSHPNGQISTAAATLIESQDRLLMMLGRWGYVDKLLSTYVPKLYDATSVPLHPYVDVLVATGRTAMSNNFQTMPATNGLRECFVPRPGNVFISNDYDSAELRSLAQTTKDIVGYSRLQELYAADAYADPHTMFAARLLGISEDEAFARKAKGDEDPIFKDARDRAKISNFGFPGGLGVEGFVNGNKKKVISKFMAKLDEWSFGEHLLTIQEGDQLRGVWGSLWPEMKPYFEFVNSVVKAGSGKGRFKTTISGRYRGGCGYCDGANYGFQPVTSDGAKRAGYEMVRRMYVKRVGSVLYGSRLVNHIHDEWIAEAPEEIAPEVAEEMSRIMVEAMQHYTPDVPATTSPALMRAWHKKAETVRDESGRLQVWEPKKKKEAEAA